MAELAEVARRVQEASRLTVLTGAGVSAASGVPTFRGAGGLWRSFRAETLATPEAFARDPRLVWEWYDWRRGVIANCRPNAAHEVLAHWSRRPGFALVTQNVDGLHERAGTAHVIRLHGSIWHLRCAAGCSGAPEPWPDASVPLGELPPRCPACGGLARPAVVWFGEPVDPAVWDAALAATACDVFLTVGTSAIVYPAASLVHEAKRRGAWTVEINLEGTPASSAVDLALHGPAEQLLPAIDRLMAAGRAVAGESRPR
jgi:NAD-dependent deacetylase